MSLKIKVASIIAVIFLLMGAVDYCIRQCIIFPAFLSLENEEAMNDASRIKEAYNREIRHLDSIVHDWAAWDDTYEFMSSAYEEYIESNITLSTFENTQLNLLYFAAEDGRIIWSGTNGLDPAADGKLKNFIGSAINSSHPFRSFTSYNVQLSELSISGIYATPAGFFIISSRPVLTSDNKGPARGVVIMGTLIDDAFVQRISEQIKIPHKIVRRNGSEPDTAFLSKVAGRETEHPVIVAESRDLLKIYTAVNDISGKDELIFKADIPRKIMKTGYATTYYAKASILGTMISAFIIMILLIHWMVVKPVLKLKKSVVAAQKERKKFPEPSKRRDEIGVLGREFVQLLEMLEDRSSKLEALNMQLTEDITARKQAEKALLENEEQLQNILENIPVGVFVHDFEGRYVLVNDVACRITGYSRDELLKMSVSDIDPVKVSEVEKELADRIISRKGYYIFESCNRRKDGSTYPAEIHIAQIMFNGTMHVLSLVLDITDRKQAEDVQRASAEKKARSKKMESLGLMAGGVAHDLNNVLSGIVSYPEMILMDLPEDSRLIKPIKTIHESGLRAVAIVSDLLTIARGVAVEKEPFNLNSLVHRYLNSAEHRRVVKFNPDIKIKTELDDELFNIKGSSIHIGKSLMNIVLNASEALEGSGEILIKTENRFLDRVIRGYEEVNKGEYVVLTVADNGEGISATDLERIFEPFYSKKFMGRSGTGLGLAIVWNVMQEHDGYIDVVSGEEGTRFDLYFPITREEESPVKKDVSIEEFKGNGETVLVVDDDEGQRDIFCSMLRYLGYTPASVKSGEEAVSYLADNQADLIVLDMIMGQGMNGKETYEKIIEIIPGQKAIIASGFAETEEVKETQRLGAGIFVKKPVSLEKFGYAIKTELGK